MPSPWVRRLLPLRVVPQLFKHRGPHESRPDPGHFELSGEFDRSRSVEALPGCESFSAEPLVEVDGDGVAGFLADLAAQVRRDGQLVRAVAEGHEGAGERRAIHGS
jgi:hypothetical protein